MSEDKSSVSEIYISTKESYEELLDNIHSILNESKLSPIELLGVLEAAKKNMLDDMFEDE